MRRWDRAAPPEPAPMPTLFDHGLTPIPVATPPSDSIDAAFDAFHTANPWVCAALVDLAVDLHARGRERVGMKMLFEVLRWQHAIATVDAASDFKLNNSYTSRYARLIMDTVPSLDGIFETRRLTS